MKRYILIAVTIIILSVNQAFAGKLLYKYNDDYGRTYSVTYLSPGNYGLLFNNAVVKITFLADGTADGHDENGVSYRLGKVASGVNVLKIGEWQENAINLASLAKPGSAWYILFMKARKHYLKYKNNLKYYLKYNK